MNFFFKLKRKLFFEVKKAIPGIYHQTVAKIFRGKLVVLDRHGSYEDYVRKQKEKTQDPERVAKWFGEEWDIKLEGFRDLFRRNMDVLSGKSNAICLGARTGQEVCALQELGIEAIGIDLVPFPPYTVEGDIHNLQYSDEKFDFVFTNIFDHSPYPEKFVSEMERVCAGNGVIVINLQVNTPGDDYSENIVYDTSEIERLFAQSSVIESRKIKNTFDSMNHEIVLKKQSTSQGVSGTVG